MDRRTIVLTVFVFVLIIIGMFTFTGLMKKEAKVDEVPQVIVEESLPYSNGLHTYVGELEMPTPCDLVEAKSTIRESLPEQVTLDFTVINNSQNCTQVITSQRFLVEAKASKEATTRAFFMGREVILNLIPALPGESPLDFELFIKG
jgi:hypothetical protein